MNNAHLSAATEAVIKNHLRLFREQKGAAAIAEDYAEDARLYGEAAVFEGKPAIRAFFTEFLKGVPPSAIPRFVLRSLRVDGKVGYITWNIGDEVPLGTDTFIVEDGKIVSQTFAMHAARPLVA